MRTLFVWIGLWVTGTLLAGLVAVAATDATWHLEHEPQLWSVFLALFATVLVSGTLLFVAVDQHVRSLLDESGS